MALFPQRSIHEATLDDLERIDENLGRERTEEFLNNEFDDFLRNFFLEHEMIVTDNIHVNYDPEGEMLEPDQRGLGVPTDFGDETGGIVYIGTSPDTYPTDFDFLLSSTAGEKYLHAHYPHTVDEDVFGDDGFDRNAVDVIGNALTLYTEDCLDDPEVREDYLEHLSSDYNIAVARTTAELLKDFDKSSSDREMMSHALNNPEPVFRRYQKNKEEYGI